MGKSFKIKKVKKVIASIIADKIINKLLINDKILIKKLNKNAIIPKYETQGASGLDLKACLEKNNN